MRFDRNNLRKVLNSPLLLLGALASVFVRRRPNQWVFGSGIGYGEGGVALSQLARERGATVVWLSDKPAGRSAAESDGFRALPKSSFAGWRATLTAGTLVVSHGLGDVNPYAMRGARIVQLWHGVPLKHLHRDAGVTYSLPRFPGSAIAERMLRAASERAYSRITYFVVASPESGRRLASAFGLREDQVLVTGDPRDDVLLRGDESDRRRAARLLIEAAIGTKLDSRVVMFAPTWRDGKPDPMVPTQAEWDAIERLAQDSHLTVIIRPHPLAVGAYREGIVGRAGVYLLDVTRLPDITPALAACDVLITDYSSIAYDYSLLSRPMVFFTPDLEEYAESRGFYEPITEFCGGEPVRTWAATIAAVQSLDSDEVRDRAIGHAQTMAQRAHAYRDGLNTERVVRRLLER